MRWVLVISLLVIAVVPTPVTAATEPTALEVEVHQRVNAVRADKDMHDKELAQLKLHSVLIDVARDHSRDMLENDYFSHVNPEGKRPADRVSEAGVDYTAVAENLFFSSGQAESSLAEDAVQGWTESKGHYLNMIGEYRFTGVGIASRGETYYITQVFVNADPAHLENIGRIYDNDNLDEITQTDEGFQLTAMHGAIITVVFFIVLGLDAKRRNQNYYRRRL